MKNPTRNMNYPVGRPLSPNYQHANPYPSNFNVQPLNYGVSNEYLISNIRHPSIKNSRNIVEIKQSMDSL